MDGLKIFLDDTKGGNPLSTLWDDIARIGNTSGERLDYPTQKPEALLNRIIDVSSNKNDLVMDFFAGSGTTLSCAENLGRRWIGCDLSRWAIQIARKRLLDHAGCRPFEVLNLGKYERQFWQGVTFGGTRGEATVLHQYLKFVLDLYKAEPMVGLVHLHGQRAGRMVHVGAADAHVTLAEIREALDECRKIKQSKLDILDGNGRWASTT
jgi:adenine-specific DNA-methyltransferase